MGELLKIKEAATILNCCPKVVRGLMNDGKLAFVPLTSSARGDRIDKNDLTKFMIAARMQKEQEACPSIKGAGSGGASFNSKVNELENRLGRPRKERLKRSSGR